MASTSPPPVPAISTADAALVAIAERRLALKGARRRFLDAPDPDALHDLRVAIRRLRAALMLFAPAIEMPRRASDRRLRRLGRSLTELRDADVVLGAVTSEAARAAGIEADLVARLEEERQEATRQACRELRRRRTKRLLKGLARWERNPRFAVEPEELIGASLPARLREHAEAFAALPSWGLKLRRDEQGRLEDAEGALDRDGVQEALHRHRRQAKKLRYQLEVAGPLLGLDEAPAVAHLRRIQDALGELQDVRVIETAVDGFLPVEQPEAGFHGWLRERRYRALEEWRRLRRDRAGRVLALVPDSALPAAD